MERSQPGNELAELLWENGPALQWTSSPAPFPPFSCSTAGTTRAQELGKHPASATVMAQGDHDDAVPCLHYPIIGVDDGVTEYCGVLPQYHGDIESTLVHMQTNRQRSTPLFSEQRMVWLQSPKESPAPPPPPAPPGPGRPAAKPAAALPQRLQPEVRAPATTTSSVCSDNGDRSQLKRSSTGHMDVDDEAGGLRKSAARSTKRGRTAERHNKLERRRRDRINEKMRALQELIPNCNNKIDKASMLEEAIEYLKTLQLQVQMMSTMGTAGLCGPPMLAMQHKQMPPMAHFHHHHHLGAMGFGMGAFDPGLVPYPMIPSVPMFHQAEAAAAAEGAHMVAGTVTNNAAAAQAEQTPSDHPKRMKEGEVDLTLQQLKMLSSSSSGFVT